MPRRIYSLLLLVQLLFVSPLRGQTSKLPALIDREIFFGDPEIINAQLSPDGSYIAFIKPYKGTRNIWVKKREEPFTAGKPLTADTTRPIGSYTWSRDGQTLLYVQDKGGNENFNLYAVQPSQVQPEGQGVPPSRNLTDMPQVRTMIYHLSRSEPNMVYIGLNNRDKAWHDLYRLNLATGEKTLLRENTDRITGWTFDWNDKLRLATRSVPDGSTEILRVEDKELRPIYSINVFETGFPVGFHEDNRRFYLRTDKGNRNFQQLVLFDPSTLQEELVESDPKNKVDLEDVRLSEVTHAPIFVTYHDDRMRRYWKDKTYEKDFQTVEQRFQDRMIFLGSATKNEQYWMVHVLSDVNPEEVYLFDRKTRQLTFQYRPRPKLPMKDLASMQVIRYKSSDGLEIPAYLTLPKNAGQTNLPLIVVPHGGPWSRDRWGYNSYHQFLANRGYAVLSPNFRGSTGYGKEFLNAGNKEWGQKMQDDITWGVKHLIAQGIVDPKRVGIMGVSYGGYATLAGLAFTPDVYAAGVSIVGPSNLNTLLATIPPYWESIRKMFFQRMGDTSTPEGQAQLTRQSPLFSADKIKAPLLVVQGANDPRVNKAESDQIVVALRTRGFPVEYLVAPDEGHGFARPVNNMAMLAAAEKFLAKHLGGRYQESMSPAVATRLKEITVDVKSVAVAPPKGE
ncbi:S9 family peptidase [Rufibacter latericius]|uniref:S9 family peptidase n=1 Tax=Rufibacter latericius TaxID=2487040 RepID=A0A3M9MVD5_9BACT|nr:S9 family peptidase [Rufibacter latericius]RNI28883.1 S9 family peptidase [Rufibacter latericius]